MSDSADGYDRIPYPSLCHPQTNPDLLGVLGVLFGGEPAPAQACRVLELGCASGGNLLPLAERHPGSRFVGIDRSAVQIDAATAEAQTLGLTNVEFLRADLRELDPGPLGRFDYVLAHGLYSWIPPEIQDRTLALLPRLMRPEALAMLSYNVYPGWHPRTGVRALMRYAAAALGDLPAPPRAAELGPDIPEVARGRAAVELITDAVRARLGQLGDAEPDAYALALARERALLRKVPDAFLAHEHLEPDNHPLYFHEFIARVRACGESSPPGLDYLCDAKLSTMVARDLPHAQVELLARVAGGDPLVFEQLLDFVRNRELRASVLRRGDRGLERQLQSEALVKLRFAMHAQPQAGDAAKPLAEGERLTFRVLDSFDMGPDMGRDMGVNIVASDAVTKAALVELCSRWPQSLGFDELEARARARLEAVDPEALAAATEGLRQRLVANLTECLLRDGISVRRWEPSGLAKVRAGLDASSWRPRLSAFNRRSAARRGWIASHLHRPFVLDPSLLPLAPLLDGTRDREALVEALVEAVARGELTPRKDGAPIVDPQAQRAALDSYLGDSLRSLARLPALT